MTLQLNPDTTDDYESKSLAQMRQMVFDGLGFIAPFAAPDANYRENLKDMRTAIINRLGLAVALLVGGDSFATVLTNVYNACGFAALGTHPPGVDTLLTDFINQAQQMLFRRIELDKGQATLPVAGTISIDSALVQSAAIALAKAHYGQPDAQAYGQQAEKYLSDLTQRTPPNIVGQINSALVGAHNSVFRRYEMNGLTNSITVRGRGTTSQDAFGFNIKFADDYTLTTSDGDLPQVDDYPVRMLALANLKTKIGQPDAKLLFDEYEQYMSDVFRRTPPNATSIVNNQLKITQQTLYRKYDLFRMERWWTWSLVAGQRFYGTFGADDAKALAPTNVLAVPLGPVVSHRMVTGREYPSSALLHDGTLLIAGGDDIGNGFLNTAELFDPATGTFSLTGPMITARTEAAGCLLADGRFFISGGYPWLNVTEIYDPTTKTWVSGPNLSVGRNLHACTLLQDGTVLITGGDSAIGSVVTNTAEIFNPATGTMTTVGNMAVPRSQHVSIQLANGSVLVAGGYTTGGSGQPVNSGEIYNPVAKTFSNVSNTMSSKRTSPGGTLLKNGKVLISGGSAPSIQSSCDLYDPATGAFASAGAMPSTRFQHYAILLESGNVLAVGGFSAGTFNTTTAIYDPTADSWTAGPAASFVSNFGAAALMQDDRVLVAGGTQSDVATDVTDQAMFYDEGSNAFSFTGSLTQGSDYYVITAYTANGESLPSMEYFLSGVTAETSVKITWTPVPDQPFVLGFKIYRGKTSNTEQYIASVTRSAGNTYTDDGTIPADGALPTENNTQGPGSIDPRHVTWVGLSFNDNVWNPLIKGIPPMAFGQNINGVPTNYEIRQALEIWPAPTTTDWKVQIKGYFEPQVFEDDNDETTLDWQAIYLQTLADAMPRFRNQKGQPWFNQLEIAQANTNAMQYIKRLVAGTHMTARYVPGVILERNAVRPVLVGPYVGYP